jgi:ferrous iron transport protein B
MSEGSMKIALTGNPNSGKTTLFNALTGKVEHVGNWAGVTVDKKEGKIKKNLNPDDTDLIAVDLPGAYSISPYTNEESITKQFIINEAPDVIINIVDSTNLSRSLFFTTQLLELGIPVVVALNKSDLTTKKIIIDENLLGEFLNCPVVKTTSTKLFNNGLKDLIKRVIDIAGKVQSTPNIKAIENKATMQGEADLARFAFVKHIMINVESRNIDSTSQTRQDKWDRIIAHKWLGIPIFIAVIWVVFSISQSWVGPWVSDIFVGLIDQFYFAVQGLLGESANPILSSLLLDGIIGGFSAIVGFLPLIMVLFFCLALLEDCGYMARVAIVMDRFFKKVGLSGRSVIPMVIGTGCAVPGIMATRTIKSERQRRTTAMLAPLMPCGAKLPIIALFAGVFFSDNPWVGTSMYFLGIVVIILGALIIRRITGDHSKSYFIMEVPAYRLPSIKRAAISMLSRAKSFLIKAGTVILLCNTIVHLLQTFTWQFEVAQTANHSILAGIASPLTILFIPLGIHMWQFTAAAITGFIAKENVVGTLAVCFSITNFIDTENLALVGGASDVATVFGITSVAALSYLVFNLFTPPCFAAIGAISSEVESPKWLWGSIGFLFSLGYTLSFTIYQVGTLLTTGAFGSGFIGGIITVTIMVGIIVFLMKKGDAKVKLAS